MLSLPPVGYTCRNYAFRFGVSLAFRVVVPCCDETITGDWLSGLILGVGGSADESTTMTHWQQLP